MASNGFVRQVSLFISLFILFTAVASVPEDEIQSMLTVLRSRSYSLFCNALVTSDIYYDVLNGNSFTFFVPTDISLYSLDMTVPAPQYIATLRHHVIPRRLSVFELPSVSLGHALQTMDLNVEVHVGIHPLTGTFTVEGVEIVMPGLFYGPNVAVHGLGGILNLDSYKSPPPMQQNENLLNNGTSPSPVTANGPQSSSVAAPPPSRISYHENSTPATSPVHDLLPPPYESFSRHNGLPDYGDGDSLSRSRGIDSSSVASPPAEMSKIDSVPVASPTTEMSQIDLVPVVSPVTGSSKTFAPFNSEIHSVPVVSPVTGTSDKFAPFNSEIHSIPVVSPATGTSDTFAPFNSEIHSVPVVSSVPGKSDTFAPSHSEIHSDPVASPVIDMPDTFSPSNPGFAQGISPAYGLLKPEGKATPRRKHRAASSSKRHNPPTSLPDSDVINYLDVGDDYFHLPPLIKLLDKTKLLPSTQHEEENGEPKYPPAATTEMPRLSESGSIYGHRIMPDEYPGMIEEQQTYSDL